MFWVAAKLLTAQQYSLCPLTGEKSPNQTRYPVPHVSPSLHLHRLRIAYESLYSAYNSGQFWVRDTLEVAYPASHYSSQGQDRDRGSEPVHEETIVQIHQRSYDVLSDAQLQGSPQKCHQ